MTTEQHRLSDDELAELQILANAKFAACEPGECLYAPACRGHYGGNCGWVVGQRRATADAALALLPDLLAELSRLRAEHNPDALEPGDPWDNPGRNPHRCKSWSGCVGVSEQCASYRNHDGPHSWAVAALVPVRHPEADFEDDEFYTRPDGIEDATWMRPHRELIAGMPLTDAQKLALNEAFDAAHITTIENRSEEHQTEHDLLQTLLRRLQPVQHPTEEKQQ